MLPGAPDLVFPGRRKVIFVHGCFWHRHRCKRGGVVPQTRGEYWLPKLEGNRARDLQNRQRLRKSGWDVMIVWECQAQPKRTAWLARRITAFLESSRDAEMLGSQRFEGRGAKGNP
jgi:DNA mismatch endonuclease (patch repair protein)